jgi:hypothetical protein
MPSGAGIAAYKVRVCQSPYNPYCNDNRGNDLDRYDTDHQTSFVQESGIACVPANNGQPGQWVRDMRGITNNNPNPHEFDEIECGLTEPADDSYEHNRTLSAPFVPFSELTTRVYYTGGSSATCVQDYTCPACWLTWHDRYSGNSGTTDYFQVGSDYKGSFVAIPSNTVVGYENWISITCNVPPMQTVVGITSTMTLTRVSGGI